jgi:hypothetical protein
MTCPKYQGKMMIISFIEDEEVIEKILKHLCLWNFKVRPSPKVKAFSVTISIDDLDSQVPFSSLRFYPDPEYSMDSHRISKPSGVTPLVAISVIYLPFLDHPKCFDTILIY